MPKPSICFHTVAMGQECATETGQTVREGAFAPCVSDCDNRFSKEQGCFGAEAKQSPVRPMPPPPAAVSPEADTGSPVRSPSPRKGEAPHSPLTRESIRSANSKTHQISREASNVREPLTAAVKESRYCAAEKEFRILVQTQRLDPESQVSKSSFQIEDVDIERFSRIATKMEKAMQMSIDMLPSNFDISETNASLNLCWGLKVVDERIFGTFSCTVPLNIIECCVVEIERDLESVHSLYEIKTDFLKGLPDDAIWRRQSQNKETGYSGDDVELVSVCDALDEHGCIMRMKYLPDDMKFPYGVTLDDYGLEQINTTNDGACSFVKLVPTSKGTEVHSVFEGTLPENVANVLRSAPGDVLKNGSRTAYENWVSSVVPWANSKHGKAEILRRLNRSPYSRLYKNLAFHVFHHDPGHVKSFPFPR